MKKYSLVRLSAGLGLNKRRKLHKPKPHKRHRWLSYTHVGHRLLQRCPKCGVKRFKPDSRIVNTVFPADYIVRHRDIVVIERDPIKKLMKSMGYTN